MIKNMKPLIEEIEYADPIEIFYLFADKTWSLFLDSSDNFKQINYNNRYSFICIDPFEKLVTKNGKVIYPSTFARSKENVNPFRLLKDKLIEFNSAVDVDDLFMPFQSGAAGYFSYDLCHHVEQLPRPRIDDMQFPDIAIGFYDLILGFDHFQKKAYVFSSGLPEILLEKRRQKANERLVWVKNIIAKKQQLPKIPNSVLNESEIKTDFTKKSYMGAVEKVIDYIRNGDIFEANLSQRFKSKLPRGMSSFDLYRRLRLVNPAPFSAYMKIEPDITIASASPERFILANTKGELDTRPIKGTRKRGSNSEEDDFLSNQLLSSEKDRAENVMIVDLLRNDFSRVCEDGSVKVPGLCELETYETVHHLVSTVKGKLRKDYDVVDLLTASFPGGSITGAPKVRSMEIISELEPNHRGPYCGSIGYIGFNGAMDTSIAIRTYSIKGEEVTYQAGGAVVIDSDPELEYEETLHKAYAFKKALISTGEDKNDFVN